MTEPNESSSDQPYMVVARRYRPQVFSELIGQEHIAKALCGAIATNRVGHAYLFTGARGVGKTSAARIFAKALNCVEGPAETSCNVCDICQCVAAGDDVIEARRRGESLVPAGAGVSEKSRVLRVAKKGRR